MKFAPLPEVERSKKRKHNHTLGVAARSQMLARRRQILRDNEDADRPPKHLWQSDEDDENEDPLITLGHMVKLASIGIWRKVSFKDRKNRPDVKERSNRDSTVEITGPVNYADDEDTNTALADGPAEDDNDEKPSLPQTEVTSKTVDDGVVVVQTQAVSAVSVPTEEQ